MIGLTIVAIILSIAVWDLLQTVRWSRKAKRRYGSRPSRMEELLDLDHPVLTPRDQLWLSSLGITPTSPSELDDIDIDHTS